MIRRRFRVVIVGAVLAAVVAAVGAVPVLAQWPTTCVELNDIVETHLGNDNNVGIYQRVFGDQAEAACQNDHRDDVRGVFAWAFDQADLATQTDLPDLAWPTDCVELNDIVEAHLGNDNNVEIYQRVFGEQAEPACRNDHRADVRGVFAWAFNEADIATPTPESTVPPTPTAPRLQETYNALSRPEQECIQNQLGEENLEIFLRTSQGGLYDHPEHWQPAAIFGCLKRDTANDVFMAFYEANSQISEAVLACVRDLLEEIDIAEAAWGFQESATDEQRAQALNLLTGEIDCHENHGPSADSPEPPGPPPPEHALLWEFKIPQTNANSFPGIASTTRGGTLFLVSPLGQVYALDAKTGQLQWQTELDDQLYPPPVVTASKVYVDGITDYYTLDVNTGELLETKGGPGPQRALLPDPETGRTYRLDVGLPPGTRVHAVDAATGTRVWTYDVGSIVPVAPTQSGGTVFVRSCEGAHALDESTGELLWETEWEYVGDYPPYIVDGIWPVAGDGTVTALDARTGKRLWSFGEDRIRRIAGAADGLVLAPGNVGFYAFEAATGKKRWSLNKDWGVFHVTVADGVMYSHTLGSDLHALDLQTGEPLRTQRIGYLGDGRYHVADGVVYIAHREGVRAYRAPTATTTSP